MSLQRAPSRLLDFSDISEAVPKELVGDFSTGLLYLVSQTKQNIPVPLVKSVFELTKGDVVLATYDPTGSNKTSVDINNLFSGTNPISISNGVISHATSGVTASAYGETGNKVLDFGDTFQVPSFTVDDKGHLTVAAVYTMTMPQSPSVSQAETANKLSTPRTIALSGRVNGSVSFDGSTNVTMTTTLSGVKTNYSATIPNSGWSGSAAPYTKTITVSGILASDTPIADVVCSGTYTTDQQRIEEWSKIYRITTAANSITVYATAIPSVQIPITLQCIRN